MVRRKPDGHRVTDGVAIGQDHRGQGDVLAQPLRHCKRGGGLVGRDD
jgi:hypothetical protein